MKKLISVLILFVFSLSAINAQFTKLGGGITASTGTYFNDERTSNNDHKTGNPAITIKGIYELNLPFHISPSITIFAPHVTNFGEASKHIISAFLFDVNGHYVFNSLDKFEFYGLAGLNITLLRSRWKPGESSSESAIGLNMGAGSYMKLTEQLDLFGEAKYIVSSRGQFVLTAGVLLNLEWFKKNETQGK